MLTTGLIIIIFALLIRLMRDVVGFYIIARIDAGEITNSKIPQYRLLWRFLMQAYGPALLLGIGLIITKLIQ